VNSSPGVDTSDDLSTDELLLVTDQLIELNASHVIMSGGEVLYRPDALLVIRKLMRANILVSLETNGLLFSPQFIEVAHEAVERECPLGISISLDGGTASAHNFLRGKGTFERTVAGMNYLHRESIKFYAQCVVNARSIESISPFVELMEGLYPSAVAIQFSFLNQVGRGVRLSKKYGMTTERFSEAFAEIARAKERFSGNVVIKVPPAMIPPGNYMNLFAGDKQAVGCTSCAFPTLGVLNDGSISICALTLDNPTVSYGNIRQDRLIDVWKKARFDALRESYMNAELDGICGDCIFRHSCKGSCRAHAFEDYGDFRAPHPLCAQMEARGEFPDVYRESIVAAAGSNAA
jgi:radical SAM protein with 4Fe4S-binding SPASM domain